VCQSSSHDRPDSSWSQPNTPLPPKVEITGARSASASAFSSAEAPERNAPPPARMTGFAAAPSRSAAEVTSSGSGSSAGGAADTDVIGGTPAGPSSTSWGISTHTGP